MKKMRIFEPSSKVVANYDRVDDLLGGGNPPPVLVEVDPSNACNHGCYFCISSYIHLPESKDLETFDRSIMNKDVMMDVCKDLIDMKVRAINWTGGGEPTLNPNFVSVARLIATSSSCLKIQSSNEILRFLPLIGTIKSYSNLNAEP